MSTTDSNSIAEKLFLLSKNMKTWSYKHFQKAMFTNAKCCIVPKDLTLRQLQIIHLIREDSINTISGIANEFNLSKSSTSLTISKMVKKGYLQKIAPSENDDGRKVYFHITEKGNALSLATEQFLLDVVAKSFEHISPQNAAALCGHLDEINRLLEGGQSK